ncbi:MAG: histidinol dehydrogenase [Acidobacteria bacterium]|nr:histidinol dehydrogenase [Acidobacteriota bacterium]
MIPIYHWPGAEAGAYLEKVSSRGTKAGGEVEARVAAILASVREGGDAALREWTLRLEGFEPGSLKIDPGEIRSLAGRVDPQLREVLRQARRNIAAFHRRQRQESWEFEASDGVRLGQRITPLSSVGLYVPGGAAAYPSSLLMNAVPAQIAGVGRIVLTTPYAGFRANPVVAAALVELGLEEVYGVGGAQAIAALAYGTKTVPRVDKIVGPGNAWVSEAKRQVFGQVDIDKIAGPSEVAVVADDSAHPDHVAADLMAQAEHDEEAVALAIVFSRVQAEAIRAGLERQIPELSRQGTIRRALENYGAVLVVSEPGEAVGIVNRIAPEHLELLTREAESLGRQVEACGAIFFGSDSCEAVGDYYAGPNHVLPTGGSARFASPLGVYDFVKRTNLVKYTRAALRKHHRSIERFALAEKLDAHAHSVAIRMEKSSGQ